MGVFLLFLYLVLNGAQAPGLDFAGWNGVATGSTRIGYLVAAVLLVGIAQGKHRWDLAKER
jgi:multisubunit Na+/H+ antiporter MnhB subunit